MNDSKPSIEQLLKNIEMTSGSDPRPMRVLSQINPEFVYEQARGKKFVMEQQLIPPKYKHLIMIAVAASVESSMCTKVFMKAARLAGVTKEEMAEAIMVARQARASTIFATALEGFEDLLEANPPEPKS